MKFLFFYLFSLFFIFNVHASSNFEKISNDFELIYNEWNNGKFKKYENIFRRDHEYAFSTCVAVKCGAGALDHYNRVLNNLQNATGERAGPFGKKFTYDEYQNYKNIYFEQKESSANAIKKTRTFLKKYNTSFLKLKDLCKDKGSVTDIDSNELESLKSGKNGACNNLISQTDKNLGIFHLELSNFRTLLDYSLNENHNNSLKKSSKLLISYGDKIISIIDQGLVDVEEDTQIIASLTENLERKKRIKKSSSLFDINFLSLKKDYQNIIIDKDRLSPTVDFFYEKFNELKVSIFRYEFKPKTKNDVFEKYYFDTLKIINKNDNPEPIIRIVAFSKQIYDDKNSCEIAANRIVQQYKDQKVQSERFIVSDSRNNEYWFRLRSYCSDTFFSSKYYFRLHVSFDSDNFLGKNFLNEPQVYNYHLTLLELMGYEFKDKKNTLENNEVKF